MFLLIKFFLLFFAFSITTIKAQEPKECDTKEQLKGITNATYSSGNVWSGASVKLTCQEGYAFFDANEAMQTSILLTCRNGEFIEIKNKKPAEVCQQKCEIKQLRALQNVSQQWSSDSVPEGKALKVNCTSGHGIFEDDGTVSNSMYVRCNEGIFKQIKNGESLKEISKCKKACSVDKPLNVTLNVHVELARNLSQSHEGNPAKISNSKLVQDGDTIQVHCQKNFALKDEPTETSYEYECGKAGEKIYQCVPKKFEFERKPPTSKETNYKPEYKCDLNQLITPNALIEAKPGQSSMDSKVELGQKVEVSCEDGYSTTQGDVANIKLGYKVYTKFDVTCDSEGSGKFLGAKACVRRCDVTGLRNSSKHENKDKSVKSASSARIGELAQNGSFESFGSVGEKNELKSGNPKERLYTEINSVVEISCGSGYAVRETGKQYYYATCLGDGNFAGAQVCAPEVKACNNSEVEIASSRTQKNPAHIQNNPDGIRNGTTNVGAKIAFICSGDTVQNGPYFKQYDINPNGVPVCRFNEGTQQSEWGYEDGSPCTGGRCQFNCYNGCISGDGKRALGANKTVIKKTSSIAPIYSFVACDKIEWESPGVVNRYYIFQGCKVTDERISEHSRMIFDLNYIPPKELGRVRRKSTIRDTIENERYWFGYSFGSGNDWDRTALLATNTFDVQSCTERQIPLKEFTINYENFIQGYADGDKERVPLRQLDKGFGGECVTDGRFGGDNNYKDCKESLEKQFEINDQKYDTLMEKFSNCEKALTLFTRNEDFAKKPKIQSKCIGYSRMTANRCQIAWEKRLILNARRYSCVNKNDSQDTYVKSEEISSK